jgi:peptidoglycan LD-endopeptidase CwlK
MENNIVIDSAMDSAVALAQNPQSIAPENVLGAMELISVDYCGFDHSLRQGQIVMHKSVIGDIRDFFKLAKKLQFPIAKVIPISDSKYSWDDERSCADNNTSGFNYRVITGGTRLSNHALGLAFDVNPVQNVYIRYDKDLKEFYRFPEASIYDRNAPGTLTPDHPLVILMKERGWEWGGDWIPASGRVDYQHFEKKV